MSIQSKKIYAVSVNMLWITYSTVLNFDILSYYIAKWRGNPWSMQEHWTFRQVCLGNRTLGQFESELRLKKKKKHNNNTTQEREKVRSTTTEKELIIMLG